MPEGDNVTQLEALTQRLIYEHWDFYPTAGSRIGRHEYDGLLPDLSPGKIRARVENLRKGLAQLSAIDDSQLSHGDKLGYHTLRLFLEREIFTFTELRPLANNPMRQAGFLNVGGYVRRDYAPLADRVVSATQALDQVPDFLEVLDTALEQEMAKPVLEMSIESYAGMARFYRVDLANAVEGLNNPAVLAEFDQSREKAAGALDRFVLGLKSRLGKANGEFAIGAKLYGSMLATGEGLDVPLADLTTLGMANLEANLDKARELATQLGAGTFSGRGVTDIVAQIGLNHPTAKDLVPATRDMLEELRQALIDLEVVSVPSEDRCLVLETPTYMRYAFAAMDSAGALETLATESFYYVTPVEADWTASQQEEWLSNFNYDTLRIISIHEVFPGHFVHHLHNRYGRELPLIHRAATSYAFTEGWAHYTEQMMMETEYAQGRLELQLTQALEALVRNCRYLCSIWMHTEGMGVEEATRFFMENAYMAELPALREALRGTFDPGYLNYTLGKLMILKLAQDFRREQGAGYTLKGFHDRLLSYGAPPLPLLRGEMLTEPGPSPL